VTGLLAAFLLASQPAAPLPEHVLRFHYYRLVFFQQRARALHCEATDLDRALEQVRRRLNKRFGKDSFKPWNTEPGGAGDCESILMGYRLNLAGFRKDVDAALNAPAPAESTAGIVKERRAP
jgi:hypothetical protein